MLAALAAVTIRIGLVPTLTTTYREPHEVARQLIKTQALSPHRDSHQGRHGRRRLLAAPLAVLALLCLAAPAEGYIYWTQGNGSSGPIGRANLDGTGVQGGFITRAGSTGIADDGAHIYWTNDGNASDTIGRANLDGTRVNRNFITLSGGVSEASVFGVAVGGGYIYWTSESGNTGTIGRANLDGTGVNRSFITVGTGVFGVAVDAGHIYWTSVNRTTGTIARANLDGTGVDQRFLSGAGATDIAVDALGPAAGHPPGPASSVLSGVIGLAFSGGRVHGYKASLGGQVGTPGATSDVLDVVLKKTTGGITQTHDWSVSLRAGEATVDRSKVSIEVNDPLGPGGADGEIKFTFSGSAAPQEHSWLPD